jgi:hypothetical protein
MPHDNRWIVNTETIKVHGFERYGNQRKVGEIEAKAEGNGDMKSLSPRVRLP